MGSGLAFRVSVSLGQVWGTVGWWVWGLFEVNFGWISGRLVLAFLSRAQIPIQREKTSKEYGTQAKGSPTSRERLLESA